MTPRSVVYAFLALAIVVCTACTNSPTSATGIPSEMTLAVTIVGTGPPPSASIVATVRDEGSQPVSSAPVTFSTTAGFITSATLTGVDGVAVAILTGTAAGTSATVTASVTVDTQTVTATTIVQF